ncbi:MAG: TIR domain-containing protein, partial [Melioribacteraceae bacterium]|nr:TIR domain-containing protein [Melioribacteraceae bacterium]
MSKIFLSHASKDGEIVKYFIDDILTGGLSVRINDIFCTTTDGTKIESGEDWRNSIREELKNAAITILIITSNYKESEICLNEMGAAWVTSGKVIPLIVEPIKYSSVGIIQEPKQIEKLLDEKSLDRLKDIIQRKLDIPNTEIKSDRWSTKKIEFLTKIEDYISSHPFNIPIARDTFENLINEKNTLDKAI